MKIKNLPKEYFEENELYAKTFRQKLKWGYISCFFSKTKNNKYNIEVYFTDTETGSDKTITIKRNLSFTKESKIIDYARKVCVKYFENLDIFKNIKKNIELLKI